MGFFCRKELLRWSTVGSHYHPKFIGNGSSRNAKASVQHALFITMNTHGRTMEYGLIANNKTLTLAVDPNWIDIIRKRSTMQGFTIPDHYDTIPTMLQNIVDY
jgi:NADPH-dependent curcumin reductase CurA